MTGDNYWLVVGPVVFFLTLIGWVVLLLVGGSRDRRYRHEDLGKRGAVAGAIVEGSPAQVNSGHVIDLPDFDELDEEEPTQETESQQPEEPPRGRIRGMLRALRAVVPGRHGSER
jgi:hypothetical protein